MYNYSNLDEFVKEARITKDILNFLSERLFDLLKETCLENFVKKENSKENFVENSAEDNLEYIMPDMSEILYQYVDNAIVSAVIDEKNFFKGSLNRLKTSHPEKIYDFVKLFLNDKIEIEPNKNIKKYMSLASKNFMYQFQQVVNNYNFSEKIEEYFNS